MQIVKQNVKLFLFSDDMLLYIWDLKNSSKKLLEMTNFSNMPGYRINLQKSLVFSIHRQHSKRKRNQRHNPIHNDLKENVSVQLEIVSRKQESRK